jgi:hypothetical protein
MTDATTARAPNPTAPFTLAFNLLIERGRDLLDRLQAANRSADTTYLPKRFAAQPQAGEQRVRRALDWILALACTLAGNRFYLLPARAPRRPGQPRAPDQVRPKPAPRPSTPAQREVAQLRYMRIVLASQPVGRIAKRLARRLAIRNDSDSWPLALLDITETPAAWAARAHAEPQSEPQRADHPPAFDPEPPAPHPAAAPSNPVAYHRRE